MKIRHLIKEKFPEVLSQYELMEILNLYLMKTPEWFLLSEKMSINHHLQLDKYKRKLDKKTWKDIENNMASGKKKSLKLYTLNWGATRWNDGNYSLDFEFRETEKYRKINKGQISSIRKKRIAFMTPSERFVFFSSANSPFSLLYKSIFEVDKTEYHSVIQYMMAHKARIFLDENLEKEIMESSNAREIIHLGRQVKNFNKITWKSMYFGNHLKFANTQKFNQNKKLREILFNTQGKTLVLSCKRDSYWGIGLSMSDEKSKNRDNWNGKNMLGELLTDIRVEMMEKY